MTAPEPADPKLRETADRHLAGTPPIRVLVVGDCMLDRYVSGEVDRISPEAPVPVVRVGEERQALGGAANVAAGVSALGARCRLVALVGADDAGESVRDLLRSAGIGSDELLTATDRPTTVKTRVLARHQQMLRIDREEDGPLPPELGTELLGRARELLEWADVVLAVDYDKGVLSAGVGRELLASARNVDVPTVVDPKLRGFFEYRHAFVFKPNARELAAALGAESAPRTREALEQVRARLACRHLLVTRGEARMTLVGEGEPELVTIPSRAREVYDVTGAGDTVTAVLGLAVAGGADVSEAAALANFAAGLQVSHLGAVPIGREELRDALDDPGGRTSKPGRDEDGAFAARPGMDTGKDVRKEKA
ncbi:MAG: bifunctional heptose 7-phosphate kinase/heptose 1-phosphate adenyltransferase [Gemmatimonadota bacterium]